MDDQRYHLTLSAGGQPVMHGWWAARTTAERKFRSWKDEHGAVAGARIVLADEQEHLVLASWPAASTGLPD
ncbi:hypothetical protein ACFXKC_40965 [Streptomyces sp. NPDC059340]|uniref:hypothetical protein n=1 Tax=Streptomyces sp. NPDC059340 TaxID=3346806 RepID=UPI0036908FD3